jgi:hypothetical protein
MGCSAGTDLRSTPGVRGVPCLCSMLLATARRACFAQTKSRRPTSLRTGCSILRLPYLKPEAVPLYKTKVRRDKDEVDFNECLPLMGADARAWLRRPSTPTGPPTDSGPGSRVSISHSESTSRLLPGSRGPWKSLSPWPDAYVGVVLRSGKSTRTSDSNSSGSQSLSQSSLDSSWSRNRTDQSPETSWGLWTTEEIVGPFKGEPGIGGW